MFQRILVVCIGNICRSPTAEILFREQLEDAGVRLASAGLGALRGHPMDAVALDLLREHGHDGSGHVARQIDDSMIRQADLILAMEQEQVDVITRRAPHALGRTFLLGKWQGERDIPDPYRHARPVFEQAYRSIQAAVAGWMPHLQPRRQAARTPC